MLWCLAVVLGWGSPFTSRLLAVLSGLPVGGGRLHWVPFSPCAWPDVFVWGGDHSCWARIGQSGMNMIGSLVSRVNTGHMMTQDSLPVDKV